MPAVLGNAGKGVKTRQCRQEGGCPPAIVVSIFQAMDAIPRAASFGRRRWGFILEHAQDHLEAKVPARNRTERLEDVRPEGIQLRRQVEVGDGGLAGEHPFALRHTDVERPLSSRTGLATQEG